MKFLKIIFFSLALIFSGNALAAKKNVFRISSSDIKAKSTITNKHVFAGFGCFGENISPQINWSNTPVGTKSLALTVYDPDAPTLSGWWHWIVVNIPTGYNSLPTNFGSENQSSIRDGAIQVRNDFGTYKYGGPCPPKGNRPHRYIFTIYALGINRLDLNESSTAALASFLINQNTIAKTSFEAYYDR